MNTETKPARKKRGEQFDEAAGHSTRGVTSAFLPSGIEADHSQNMRWLAHDTMPELVKYLGARCCFTTEQIEQRLRSLKSEGQITPVTVYASATGRATLVDGYLRHAAFLLAEVRGELDTIPRAKGKILGIEVKQPKNAEDWAALADRNLAENRERAALSDTDLAFYVERRLPQFVREFRKTDETLSEKAATKLAVERLAEKLGLSTRHVQRYRQLAQSKPATLLAVHIGALTMTAALRTASTKGEGSAIGPRAGINRKAIRRALAATTSRPLPNAKAKFTAEEAMLLAGAIVGEVDIDDLPEHVAELVGWLDAPAGAGKVQTGESGPDGRKAPPKHGAASSKEART